MDVITFLILFPLAISLLAQPPGRLALRRTVGVLANATLCAVPIYPLITTNDSGPVYFRIESRLADAALPAIELLIAGYLIYLSVKADSKDLTSPPLQREGQGGCGPLHFKGRDRVGMGFRWLNRDTQFRGEA